MTSRKARLALAITLLAALVAQAQDAHTDVPAGPARIDGRLLHPSDPAAAGGVRVLLYSISSEGVTGLRATTSEPDGRFHFDGISNDPTHVYLVGTRAGEVPFGTRVVFKADELEKHVEIALSETTEDPTAVQVGNASLRFEQGCTHLIVHQVQTLENRSDAVIFVPEQRRAEGTPLLDFGLPEAASGFESAFGEQGVELVDGHVRYWGPLYAGTQQIEFSYALPLDDTSAVELAFDQGASGLEILTPGPGIAIASPALTQAAPVERDGQSWLRQTLGALPPRRVVALSVARTNAAPESALATLDAQFVLELDDAALDVQEQHQIHVSSEAPLAAATAPLLCIPLPQDAQDLRFSANAMKMGLSRDPTGALAIHGPIPAGVSVLALRYLLPVKSEPMQFERRFATKLPRLSVLVADTGLVPSSDRLHQLRPVRTEDRTYLSYEGFSIAPGETVSMTLRRLAPRHHLSEFSAASLVLITALVALGFLSAPLRATGRTSAQAPTLSRAALERQAVMSNIRDLDEDFETGKLSAEDHAQMRDELRARAVTLLAEERRPAPRALEPQRALFCTSCGAALHAGDRFCSQCGAPVAARSATGAAEA
jgi:zinc-ribbon domain